MNHQTLRRRGSVMAEMVLIMPTLLIVLAFVFYFGRNGWRVLENQMMSRFSAWRTAYGSPGPHWTNQDHYRRLSSTFLHNETNNIGWRHNDGHFSSGPYDELETFASAKGEDPSNAMHRLLYHRNAEDHRLSRGHRRGFVTRYTAERDIVKPLNHPIRKTAGRLGNDWRHQNGWRASKPTWRGQWHFGNHHMRANRDAFFLDIDQMLDGLDGNNSFEYDRPENGVQHAGSNFAGFIRQLWLRRPGYAGPIVRE